MRLGRWLPLILTPLAIACPARAHARHIPVVRYALERWERVPCEVVVLHCSALAIASPLILGLLRSPAEKRGTVAASTPCGVTCIKPGPCGDGCIRRCSTSRVRRCRWTGATVGG